MYFSIDELVWSLPCDITRTTRIEESSLSGQTVDGHMLRDYIGTYFDFNVKLAPNPNDMEAYYTIYEKLCEPCDHLFVFPYNSDTLQILAKVENMRDVYVRLSNGAVYWKGIQFDAISNDPTITYADYPEAYVYRGFECVPDIQNPTIGDKYIYTTDGWQRINN